MFDDVNDRLARLAQLKSEAAELAADTAQRRRALNQQRDRDARERRSEPDDVVYKQCDHTESEAAATNTNAWCDWVDERVNAAIMQERNFTMDVLAQSLAGFMDRERVEIQKETELMTAEIKLDLIVKLEEAISTMRRMLNSEPGASSLPATSRTVIN
jgi:hypothetical protein